MESKVVWHRVMYDDEGWTSEVLPKPGPVLVTTVWGDVATDTVIDGKDGLYFEFYGESVTAWAEMPGAYRMEG